MLDMKYPSKFASLLVVAVLGLAGLTVVTSAFGDSGRWGHSAWAGGKGHGGKSMCGRHGGMFKHGAKARYYLAEKLSVMETEIGIRADQIDAWRDFTDALLATMPQFKGPAQGQDAGAPFSLAEQLADSVIARAKSAEALKEAIAKLRTTLTPEQLDKVKAIEAKLRSRHGHGHHGMGSSDGPSDHGSSDTPDSPDEDDDDSGPN
jgi:hypothetical protein